MTYREALLFIGKSLTLGCYPDRIRDIQSTIGSGNLDWEQIVQISTGQFVFPTLYLQLKRAGLSEDLPADLVEYMEEFTSLNRERNQQILEQALELISLLNQKGIEPT